MSSHNYQWWNPTLIPCWLHPAEQVRAEVRTRGSVARPSFARSSGFPSQHAGLGKNRELGELREENRKPKCGTPRPFCLPLSSPIAWGLVVFPVYQISDCFIFSTSGKLTHKVIPYIRTEPAGASYHPQKSLWCPSLEPSQSLLVSCPSKQVTKN